MQTSDSQLLRQYVENGSQAAFSRLVERYMAMVYWTCRRDVKDAELAEDAAQAVFVLLAHKAKTLAPSTSISGWLFTTARFVSKSTLRTENRQRRLAQEAAISMQQSQAFEPPWSSVEPWLNDALSNLSAGDREALLLRYFGGLSLAEVAAATGATEPAARKRVSRALDRLRQFLLKKEVAVAPAALAALLTEHTAAKAAPLDSHAAAMHALRAPMPAHVVYPLTKGILIMSTTKLIAGGAAAVVAILLVTAFAVHKLHSAPPARPAALVPQARRDMHQTAREMAVCVQKGDPQGAVAIFSREYVSYNDGKPFDITIQVRSGMTLSLKELSCSISGNTATVVSHAQWSAFGSTPAFDGRAVLTLKNISGGWLLSGQNYSPGQ